MEGTRVEHQRGLVPPNFGSLHCDATWWLGKQTFSARAVWTAGLLLMFKPAYTEAASRIFPIFFAAALITAALALVFRAHSVAPSPPANQQPSQRG